MKAYNNFRLKYLRILSDTNLKKYIKKKNNFKLFFCYSLFLYILSVTIFIIIWLNKNNVTSVNINDNQYANSTNIHDISYKKSSKYNINEEIFNKDNSKKEIYLEKFLSNKSSYIIRNLSSIETISLSMIGSQEFYPKDYYIKTNDIQNLIFIQGIIIFIQTLLLISFIVFHIIKFRLINLIYSFISFFCVFNNFVQFQLLSLIVTKILPSEFHGRFTVPYIHSALVIFYTLFIDSDYYVNGLAAFISGILIFVFSIGYDWTNDFNFLVGIFLIIGFCYFTFKIEFDKKTLFLIDENYKNNLKNIMSTLENLNSGIIIYRKNEIYEYNKKFIEIFKLNINLANEENLNKDYLKIILFTNLTEFNNNLGKEFLENLEFYHRKFLNYENILFEIISNIETLKKLEEELAINNLVNNFIIEDIENNDIINENNIFNEKNKETYKIGCCDINYQKQKIDSHKIFEEKKKFYK